MFTFFQRGLGVVMVLGAVLALPASNVSAQSATTVFVKFLGLSIHPHVGHDAPLYVRKIDSSGRFIVNIGAIAGGDMFFRSDRLGMRVAVGALSDSRGALAGVGHLGPRVRIVRAKRFSLYGGIGPTLYFRQDWHRKFPGYRVSETRFDTFRGWEYIFAWYGGELEINYRATPKSDLSITLVPGYPEIISLAIGIKSWR